MTHSVSGKVVGLDAHLVSVSPKTTWIVLCARLDDGTLGWGEATDFGNEAAVLDEVALLHAALADAQPPLLAPALALLQGRQVSQARNVVRNAFEQALLDAEARRAGLPLARLLGGPHRSAVPVYANINRGIADRSPAGFAARAAEVVASGYRAIKIAPFDGFRWHETTGRDGRARVDAGLARIFAVRDAIGPDIDLLVDCHSRFDPAAAAVAVDALAPANLFWLEDVLDDCFGAPESRAIRSRAHRAGFRIAGAETIATLPHLLAFLADGGTDAVLPDLRLTGIRNGMAMCAAAAALGQFVSLHNPVGPILDAVSCHVAAALPDFLILERPVGETPLWTELRGDAARLADGAAVLDAGDGLGLTPRADLLRRHAGERPPPGRKLSFKGMAGAGHDA